MYRIILPLIAVASISLLGGEAKELSSLEEYKRLIDVLHVDDDDFAVVVEDYVKQIYLLEAKKAPTPKETALLNQMRDAKNLSWLDESIRIRLNAMKDDPVIDDPKARKLALQAFARVQAELKRRLFINEVDEKLIARPAPGSKTRQVPVADRAAIHKLLQTMHELLKKGEFVKLGNEHWDPKIGDRLGDNPKFRKAMEHLREKRDGLRLLETVMASDEEWFYVEDNFVSCVLASANGV